MLNSVAIKIVRSVCKGLIGLDFAKRSFHILQRRRHYCSLGFIPWPFTCHDTCSCWLQIGFQRLLVTFCHLQHNSVASFLQADNTKNIAFLRKVCTDLANQINEPKWAKLKCTDGLRGKAATVGSGFDYVRRQIWEENSNTETVPSTTSCGGSKHSVIRKCSEDRAIPRVGGKRRQPISDVLWIPAVVQFVS